MTEEKVARINELTRLAKERELTGAEKTERQALREEYLDEWRRGAKDVLDNTYIVDKNGVKTKLPRK